MNGFFHRNNGLWCYQGTHGFFGKRCRHKKMSHITQKDLYEDAILLKTGGHFYQDKWYYKLSNTVIVWDEVWRSVHSYLTSNETETVI